MNHYLVPTIPLVIEVMALNPCRGTEIFPRKFSPEEFRMRFSASSMDSRGRFESTLEKIEMAINGTSGVKQKLYCTLEVKNIDYNKEIDNKEIPTIKMGDCFIVEGFLNCDIFTYIHGPAIKPEKLTFLTRCILHIQAS